MSHTANAPRGNNLRMTLGLPVAAVITAGLFLVMGGLIQNGEMPTAATGADKKIVVTPQKKETTEFVDDITRPTMTETMPEPTTMRDWPTTGPDDTIQISRPDPGDTGTVTPTTIPFSANSAVLQFNPDYPSRCASRGVEGSVTVAFDVLANGAVTNARIVRSSDGCFDRAAIDAIQKWKFMPASGQSGIIQRGVQKTFVFQLQG